VEEEGDGLGGLFLQRGGEVGEDGGEDYDRACDFFGGGEFLWDERGEEGLPGFYERFESAGSWRVRGGVQEESGCVAEMFYFNQRVSSG
jgi:hypothetical protein